MRFFYIHRDTFGDAYFVTELDEFKNRDNSYVFFRKYESISVFSLENAETLIPIMQESLKLF